MSTPPAGPSASTCSPTRTGLRSCCACTGHPGSSSATSRRRWGDRRTRSPRRCGCRGSRGGGVRLAWVVPSVTASRTRPCTTCCIGLAPDTAEGGVPRPKLPDVRVLTMDDPLLVDHPDLSGVGDLPAHTRIGSWLEQLIVSHTLAPGDKLPSEVEISNALGVSRMTLRQALASIEAKGLIDRRRGRFGGNFVAAPRFEFDHASLPGFTEQMRRIHVEAGAEVLRAITGHPTPEVRQRLGLTRGAQVHEILRARSANGAPIVL